MEKCLQFSVDLHIVFIDFKQVFDTVDRYRLKDVLEGFGALKKLVRLVHMILMNGSSRVLI